MPVIPWSVTSVLMLLVTVRRPSRGPGRDPVRAGRPVPVRNCVGTDQQPQPVAPRFGYHAEEDEPQAHDR
jgi:hypothetical protein